jgi:hypothetical protein
LKILGWLGLLLGLGVLAIYVSLYGFHVPRLRDGYLWIDLKRNDALLSPAIRLALQGSTAAAPGQFGWRQIDTGFEAAELPVLVGQAVVGRIFLARIDPGRVRFSVYNAAKGYKDLDQWLGALGAALVINGSYYSGRGTPDTPVLSAGKPLGPREYHAEAGAFVSSAPLVGIRDLSQESWPSASREASDAMVAYPLLVAPDGRARVRLKSEWLANRSFVGQAKNGWIVLGTTSDAFFSLARLADFLRQAPLQLTLALNLDGGPVACQGIRLKGFERRTYGKWELRVQGDDVMLLMRVPCIAPTMPIVLAVFPK